MTIQGRNLSVDDIALIRKMIAGHIGKVQLSTAIAFLTKQSVDRMANAIK